MSGQRTSRGVDIPAHLAGNPPVKPTCRERQSSGWRVDIRAASRLVASANMHFHSLVLDGVHVRQADGELRFCPLPSSTAEDVAAVARLTRDSSAYASATVVT